MRTHTKKSAEIAAGVSPKDAKACFVFLQPIQRRLSATYPALILTAFEIKDVNQCVHAYSAKMRNFCAGNFTGPQNNQKWALSRGCL